MDLGEGFTTRSISFFDVAYQGQAAIPNCAAKVFQTETCTGNSTEIALKIGEPAADQTCIAGNGQMLGSVQLICIAANTGPA